MIEPYTGQAVIDREKNSAIFRAEGKVFGKMGTYGVKSQTLILDDIKDYL